MPPACNFIISPKPVAPRHELRRFMFWYKMNNHAGVRHLLGSFVGHPIFEPHFNKKLNKIRAFLTYKEIPWEESFYIIHEAEMRAMRRLDNEQRKSRAITKLNNGYNKAMEAIKQSSELFKDDLIKELDTHYKRKMGQIQITYDPDREIGMPYSDKSNS